MFGLSQENQDALSDFLKKSMSPFSGGAPTPPAASGIPPTPPSDSVVTASHQTQTPLKEETDQKADDDTKIEDSHPGLTPNGLTGYRQNQQNEIGKYGPEQQKAVMDYIQKEQTSLPTTLGRMGTGFADAIMQGVARAGNPGFQKQFDENLSGREKMLAESTPKLQEMNMSKLGAQEKLEGMDNSTPLGAAMLKTWGPIMDKLGIPKAKQASMIPTLLSQIVPQGTEIKKAEGELALKDAMLDATKGHYKDESNNQDKQRRIDALKETAKHGIIHPIEANKASEELSRLGSGQSYTPDVLAYAQKHNITPEQSQAMKDRHSK